MKIRARIFCWIALLVVAVLSAVALSLVEAQRRLLTREAQKSRGAALESVAAILREAHLARDPLLLVNYSKLIAKTHPDIRWICIVDSQGRVLASQDAELIGEERSRLSFPAGLDLDARPIALAGRSLGSVELGFDREAAARAIQVSLATLKGQIVAIGVWALGVGLALSFLLAQSLSGPILALSRAAADIGEGKPTAAVAVERGDELGELARSFRDMAGRLQELDRLKQDFLAGTTHELRTPLGAIESHANAILEDLQGPDARPPESFRQDWSASLQHVKANVARLRRFIDDLLDLAKIESGGLDLRLSNVSLPVLVGEVADFFQPHARERRILLSRLLPEDLPPVHADPEGIHQVLVNLVANACRFAPSGGQVKIAAERGDPGWVRVSVSDDGPGIPQEFRKHLFTKFSQYRAPQEARERGGTGLGLAICKGIVERHGGRIGVATGSGEGGCLFFFTLPAAQG